MTEGEFHDLLIDQTKVITVDISWTSDLEHPLWVNFKAPIESSSGWPIFLKGSFNLQTQALSFTIIHKPAGRIYALDLGKGHQNPDLTKLGDKHKHRWTLAYKDKEAYVPADITFDGSEPLEVWQQFCTEAKIIHNGTFDRPPATQRVLI